MRLRWTTDAASDLEQIKIYLDQHHSHLAGSTIRKIYDEVRSLKTHPHLGRAGQREGTRELTLHPLPYVVVYRLRNEAVEILHIFHGAQDRSQ